MKLFKRKPVLTHADKLEKARVKGTVALSMFNAAHTQLEAANGELGALVEDAQAKISELADHAQAAQREIDNNKFVQSKLNEFIR